MNFYLELAKRLPVIVLILLSAGATVSGDLFAKYWSTNNKTLFFVAAWIGYATSCIFYMPTLMRQGLVVTSIIWTLITVIGFLFVGLILFKETLTPLQIFGVVLGAISLIILSVASK